MIAQTTENQTRFAAFPGAETLQDLPSVADEADADAPTEPRTFRPEDEALFRQLVLAHRHRLYRFIVKHIGWGSDAEELTQQAFVQAAHSYASFRGASELSTWLYDLLAGRDGAPRNQVRFSKRLLPVPPARGPEPVRP
ncbi:sigma factor [Ramlibacter sp. AN1015]|uniref:RNA polymerase sigma factor n=1 Tax=Ramlibacter sp. AN1015 TaxID=3133428 RepID=UPI0030BB42AC